MCAAMNSNSMRGLSKSQQRRNFQKGRGDSISPAGAENSTDTATGVLEEGTGNTSGKGSTKRKDPPSAGTPLDEERGEPGGTRRRVGENPPAQTSRRSASVAAVAVPEAIRAPRTTQSLPLGPSSKSPVNFGSRVTTPVTSNVKGFPSLYLGTVSVLMYPPSRAPPPSLYYFIRLGTPSAPWATL